MYLQIEAVRWNNADEDGTPLRERLAHLPTF
jgi:hypothetical protein